MQPVSLDHLAADLRNLRRTGRIDEARACIDALLERHADPRLALLKWQHEPFWWEPLRGPRVTLRRRGPEDVALARECWNDEAFMARFNRLAPALPDTDEALRELLNRERATIVGEARSLHWTIHDESGKVGFVTVAEISLTHRRGEFLIGVHGTCSPWVGPEASHLVLGFLAARAGIERLTACFYPENESAIVAARKLGFELEGRLRGHLRGRNGVRSDLIVAGLALDAAFFDRTARIRRRLLSHRAEAGRDPTVASVAP